MKIVWPVLAAIWIYFLAFGLGSLPPLGRLLDIHNGLFSHRPLAHVLSQKIEGLKAPVQVAWDKMGVPHIFAESEEDLYRAQGFIMASQRLFQMDLSTRQMAGRLSEWVGAKALESDQFFVHFGMRQSMKATLEEFNRDPATRMMLESFVAGVNSYISSLKHLPPEYILLGIKPEPFSLERVIYMDKALSFGLSARSFALQLTSLRKVLGTEKILDLFPEFMPDEYEDYIFENKHGTRRRPETSADFKFQGHLSEFPHYPLPNPGKGSNNWAVGPQRSSTGHSILANDTHLSYSLPNVWYESQLSTPDFNVYGVSLVSVPGIVNGFTAKVAWGPTNGTTNVLDWFEVEFENETSTKYKYKDKDKDEWLQGETHVESIVVRNSSTRNGSVLWTRLGPVLERQGRYGLVADWMGHHTGLELKALRGLYQARDFKECLSSFQRDWAVPIQNFICADPEHVALLHAGAIPDRQIGEGRFVRDGTHGTDPMIKTLNRKLNPQVVDPKRSLLSANAKVEGPWFPHYLGWDYEEPFRAKMIRRRLSEKSKFSAEDMIKIQNDAHDLQSEMSLPLLLKNLDLQALSREQKDAVVELSKWHFDAQAKLVAPTLAKAWFRELKQELFPNLNAVKDMRLIWLLNRLTNNPKDSDSQWLKGQALQNVVTKAFQASWSQLADRLGKPLSGWTWERYNDAELPNVARLPGWGSGLLEMDGSGESIRGNRGRHGPVYKAVIALGNRPRAWMQVPGGNVGDPLSPHYERNVQEWSAGQMREVEFYKTLSEAQARGAQIERLDPK